MNIEPKSREQKLVDAMLAFFGDMTSEVDEEPQTQRICSHLLTLGDEVMGNDFTLSNTISDPVQGGIRTIAHQFRSTEFPSMKSIGNSLQRSCSISMDQRYSTYKQKLFHDI